MASDSDTFNILVATDIHLGYCEKDPIRGEDSFRTFEEILQIAVKLNVDFILLGGDLFHENRPSCNSLHQAVDLIRKYCFGEGQCHFKLLSDQTVNFARAKFSWANYSDPNINVSFPIFSIHGNHDDPTGQKNLSSLDILHSVGLLNYFGSAEELGEITINPLFLTKGETKLSIYGLGSVRDERLRRIFDQRKVKLPRPTENAEDWFNLFVIHQNRVPHGVKNYIPEELLAGFLDLVIWGHEHECLIEPVKNATNRFYVSQPGSSVATCLSEGEAAPKHVGLLKITGRSFKMEKIALKSVRPFIFDNILLNDFFDVSDNISQIEAFVKAHISLLLENVMKERGRGVVPLVRLRVDLSGGFESFSTFRLAQQFFDRVANPKDIVTFIRPKKAVIGNKNVKSKADNTSPKVGTSIVDMLRQRFAATAVDGDSSGLKLGLLTESGLTNAVESFVVKDDKDALTNLVQNQIEFINENLKKVKLDEAFDDSNVDNHIARCRNVLKTTGRDHFNSHHGGDFEMIDDTSKSAGKRKARAAPIRKRKLKA